MMIIIMIISVIDCVTYKVILSYYQFTFYSKMRPLLCKAIERILILYLYGLFIAWIFTTIKKLDKTAHQRMERMLTNLRNEVDLKYNVTDNEFISFVKIAAEAMEAKEELDCNFFNICNSVVATLTTIAKPHLTHGSYFSL